MIVAKFQASHHYVRAGSSQIKRCTAPLAPFSRGKEDLLSVTSPNIMEDRHKTST